MNVPTLRAEPALARLTPVMGGPEWGRMREPEESELGALTRKLWRRKWLIAGTALGVTVLAGALVSQLPVQYRATAEVNVGAPEMKALSIQDVVGGIKPDTAVVQSEMRVLLSRGLAERVVVELGLERDPEFNTALQPPGWSAALARYVSPSYWLPESWQFWAADEVEAAPTASAETPEQRVRRRTVNVLLSKLDAALVGRSYVLEVSARSQNPETAANIANTLSEAYIEEQVSRKVELTTQASNHIQAQVAKLSGEVERAEQAVEQFRTRKGLFQNKQVTIATQQFSELNSELVQAQAAKAATDARLAAARETLSNPDAAPEVMVSPVVQQLKGQLAVQRALLADASAKYGPEHPRRIQVQQAVNDISQQLRRETQNVMSALAQEARAANARYAALQRNITTLESRLGVTNENAVQLAALERQATARRQLLENLMLRSQETVAQLGVITPDARVVSRAVINESPSDPPKTLLLVVAALVGLFLGAIIALIREGLDRTVRSGRDLEDYTGFPNLGMIPALKKRSELNPANAVRDLSSPYCNALRKLFTAASMIERVGPTGEPVLEQPKVLMVTSAAPNEGKTALCNHMAALLAKCGKSVCLIDCDARKRQFRWRKNAETEPGLGELLRGEAQVGDVLKHRGEANLNVIRPGKLPDEDYDLFASPKMATLLNELAQSHDVVLIDTPPVLVGSEVFRLARLADAVLYAVRWGDTPRDTVLEGLKQLQFANARVAGTVLTRVGEKGYRRYSYAYGYYGQPRRRLPLLRASS